jgi:solute-binding AdeT-like protein
MHMLSTLRSAFNTAALVSIITAVLPSTATAESVTMSAAQRAELAKVAPGLNITPAMAKDLRATAYDQSLSIDERITAIRRIAGYPSGEPIKRTVCIWDIVGRSGPVFTAAQDQKVRMLQYGVDVTMVPYTSESIVVDDLKAGICDAALISGLRARLFNRFTGTVDSVGGLPSAAHMRIMLQVLASPKSADKMVDNNYVVMGIAPAGGAYIFVNDKNITSLSKAAGKKVAVLDYDPTQARMVAQVGATPISSDIVSAPNKFNNGVVDVLAAPLIAYEPLELYKGMGNNGGVINYPLAQITMQLIGRSDKFPNEIAQLVREAFFQSYDQIMARINAEAAKVPAKWWIEIPEADKGEYEQMMMEARVQLRDENYYDGEMLTLQRKIRCKLDQARAECSAPKE